MIKSNRQHCTLLLKSSEVSMVKLCSDVKLKTNSRQDDWNKIWNAMFLTAFRGFLQASWFLKLYDVLEISVVTLTSSEDSWYCQWGLRKRVSWNPPCFTKFLVKNVCAVVRFMINCILLTKHGHKFIFWVQELLCSINPINYYAGDMRSTSRYHEMHNLILYCHRYWILGQFYIPTLSGFSWHQ